VPVKKFWESVNIWQRYGQNFVAYIFWATLYMCVMYLGQAGQQTGRWLRIVPVQSGNSWHNTGRRHSRYQSTQCRLYWRPLLTPSLLPTLHHHERHSLSHTCTVHWDSIVLRPITSSQAVARIADRTATQQTLVISGDDYEINWNCRATWPKPRQLLGKVIYAPARHSPYKAVYQIWSL